MSEWTAYRIGAMFGYKHLPERLGDVSRRFHDLAVWVFDTLPPDRERDKCLDHLLYAKDAAVRAKMMESNYGTGSSS